MEEKRPGQYFPVDEDETGTYIFNSRDMCMIDHIAELYEAGINSFKIEGRAKSSYYTAIAVNAYRAALDGFKESGFDPLYKPEKWINDEVIRASNREYCTGFYYTSPLDDAQIYGKGGYVRDYDVAAICDRWEDGVIYASQRNRFFEGDELEVMIKGKKPFNVIVNNLKNEDGENIESVPHPMMNFSFNCSEKIPAGAYLRKKRN